LLLLLPPNTADFLFTATAGIVFVSLVRDVCVLYLKRLQFISQ
jgi:hypothetical protein